jgi:hypothetical protein
MIRRHSKSVSRLDRAQHCATTRAFSHARGGQAVTMAAVWLAFGWLAAWGLIATTWVARGSRCFALNSSGRRPRLSQSGRAAPGKCLRSLSQRPMWSERDQKVFSGGLRSAPDCRTRRALLHLSYSYPHKPLVSYRINRQLSGWISSSTDDSRLPRYFFGPLYSMPPAFFIASTIAPGRINTVVFVARR